MNKRKEGVEIVQRTVQLLLRQVICYSDDQVVEVRLDELAEHFAPEFGGSIDSTREIIEVALDRHPEIFSKRIQQGEVIYETSKSTCREAASQESP